jgi:hypothetical protein
VERVAEGPDDPAWSDLEAAALQGVDEMMSKFALSDDTYARLERVLTPDQLIDYVFLIGEFVLVALSLNVFRIQPDPGLQPLPTRGARA